MVSATKLPAKMYLSLYYMKLLFPSVSEKLASEVFSVTIFSNKSLFLGTYASNTRESMIK